MERCPPSASLFDVDPNPQCINLQRQLFCVLLLNSGSVRCFFPAPATRVDGTTWTEELYRGPSHCPPVPSPSTSSSGPAQNSPPPHSSIIRPRLTQRSGCRPDSTCYTAVLASRKRGRRRSSVYFTQITNPLPNSPFTKSPAQLFLLSGYSSQPP